MTIETIQTRSTEAGVPWIDASGSEDDVAQRIWREVQMRFGL